MLACLLMPSWFSSCLSSHVDNISRVLLLKFGGDGISQQTPRSSLACASILRSSEVVPDTYVQELVRRSISWGERHDSAGGDVDGAFLEYNSASPN